MKSIFNKTSAIIATIAISLAGLIGIIATTPNAAADDPICDNEKISIEVQSAHGCKNANTSGSLKQVIVTILNSIIVVSGFVAVIYVIVGGVNYMTSSGDSQKTEKAKKTILYALIGMAICVLAFAIVNWAIGAIGGTAATTEDLTKYTTKKQCEDAKHHWDNNTKKCEN